MLQASSSRSLMSYQKFYPFVLLFINSFGMHFQPNHQSSNQSAQSSVPLLRKTMVETYRSITELLSS